MLALPGVTTTRDGTGADVESPPQEARRGKRRTRPRAGRRRCILYLKIGDQSVAA
jgi:hypothetical protein